MITRIVKLTFTEDHIDDFLNYFDSINQVVNQFPGCKGMKLLRDKKNPSIIFTYSIWESEEALEIYRTSEIFKEIWPTIKKWFGQKADAWTVNTHFDGFEILR
jgi:quinol monooxygenase YgiN